MVRFEFTLFDLEANSKSYVGYDNTSIQAVFIRKVFTVITIALGVIAIMSAVPVIHPLMRSFIHHNMAFYYAGYAIFTIIYLLIWYFEDLRRSFPANIIATAILILSIGYMTMMICSFYGLASVMLALSITTIVCSSIVVFSFQTQCELISIFGFEFIFSMIFFAFTFVALISIIFFKIYGGVLIYGGLAALSFSINLPIDVQMFMDCKKYEINRGVMTLVLFKYFWILCIFFGCSVLYLLAVAIKKCL